MSADPEWDAAWTAAIERLEAEVATVERLVAEGAPLPVEPWEPPEVEGTMPEALAFRAQAVLDRQRTVLATIGAAIASNREQQAVARRIQAAAVSVAEGPVYLDVNA